MKAHSSFLGFRLKYFLCLPGSGESRDLEKGHRTTILVPTPTSKNISVNPMYLHCGPIKSGLQAGMEIDISTSACRMRA